MTKTTGTQNIESTGFSNGASNIINFLVGNANAKSVVATGKTFTQAANTTFTVSAGTSPPGYALCQAEGIAAWSDAREGAAPKYQPWLPLPTDIV